MKQLDVKCVFQSAYQLTYERRGNMQLLGSSHIAQMSCHRFESRKLVKELIVALSAWMADITNPRQTSPSAAAARLREMAVSHMPRRS